MHFISKYKNMSVQVKAALWYTLCNFFQKGISFIVVPIYVRLLTTAEYGQWSVFLSWSGILIVFASLNLYCGVYTKTLVDMQDGKERDIYTSSMLGLGTISTIALLGLYIIFQSSVNRLIGLDVPEMLLMMFYFAVYPALSFWSTRQRVEYKYKRMVIVTLLVSILTPGVSILLLMNTDLRARAIIYGYLLVQSCFGLFFYIYQLRRGRTLYNKTYWSYALKFNIPLIPHYLSLIVLGQADRIMISNFCGESDAGIYSFAYSIASAMNVLISAVNGARVPWTYEKLRDRVYNQLKKVSNMLCIFMGAITLLVSLLAPEVVKILATPDYLEAIYVIPVVALGVYFTFVYDMFCGVEFYYGATQYVMIASMVGAAINVILNAVFIPIYGFIAAGYTTLFCYIIFMFMHFVFMRKVCKEQKIADEVYDLKMIFGISGISTIIAFLGMMTYQNDVVRIVSLIVLVVILFIQRDKLIEAYMGMKNKQGD